MSDVNETLTVRETTYGDFRHVAYTAQELKKALSTGKSYDMHTSPFQREAIDMICSKLARIVNGDPDYKDSWHDIAGYAKLVEDRL